MAANEKPSHVPLVQLQRRLRENYQTATGAPLVTYQQLYRGALDGVYPAEQHGTRWFVADAHIGRVAEAFALTPRSAVKAKAA